MKDEVTATRRNMTRSRSNFDTYNSNMKTTAEIDYNGSLPYLHIASPLLTHSSQKKMRTNRIPEKSSGKKINEEDENK